MSLAVVSEINRRLRAAGVVVHEWSGWESRNNGYTSAFEGGIVHHTASPYGMAYQGLVTGRSDLPGPLCNHAGNADGSLTVIAAGPANHAGASGGPSMGPLPVTNTFNRRVLGLEIVYPGTSPMRDAQYRTACIWSRIVADVVGGGNIERVRAHAETSVTGKWDPGYASGRTIDMAAFRRRASTILQEAPTVSIHETLPAKPDGTGTTTVAIEAQWAATNFRTVNARLASIEAKIGAPAPVNVDYDILADKVAARLSALQFRAESA